ncbi:MAG: T9SS type A sorting domain-containing protein [Flavobacteriales bacterium]|nr:T9SS type A sorting domain-containing protein [Flavobacteriales bacterium]
MKNRQEIIVLTLTQIGKRYCSRQFWLFTIVLSIGTGFSSTAQQWRDGWNSHSRWINDIHIKDNHEFFLFGGYPFWSPDRTIFYVPEYGQHWYNWNIVAVDLGPWILDVEYLSEDTALAVGENGSMILTVDGGFTWDSIYGDTARDMAAIEFADSNFGMIAGGDSIAHIQTIKRTVDGGNNWISIRDVTGPFLRSIYCVNNLVAVAVGDDGEVLKTVNGGAIWNSVSVPVNRHFQEVYFFDSNVGIIVGGDELIRTILRTTDGGNNWSVIMNEAGGMLHDMHFINGLKGYAVGDNGQFLTTADGGVNWTFVNVPGMTSDDQLYTVNFHSENFGILSGQWGRYFMYTNFDQPIVQTGSVTVENTGVVNFFGQVNSGGGNAASYFVCSTDPNLANSDSTNSVAVNSTGFTPITQAQWSLLNNTTYYYTCKATHLMGTGVGDTLSFFTDFGNGVQIATDEPWNITSFSALLRGHVNALNQPSTVWFDYNAFGGITVSVAASPSSISDPNYHDVSQALSGLAANTTYRYRVRVESGQSTFLSQYQQFYTGTASSIETLPATNASFNTATLNGQVEFLHLPANLSFYVFPSFQANAQGTVISAVPALISDESQYAVTANATGLIPNTYYTYQLIAQNAYGSLGVNSQQFYTGIEGAVVTDPATGVTTSSAYLNGVCVEINTYPGTAYFEYFKGNGDTTTVGAWPLSINGNQNEPLQAYVDNLESDTVYSFRVKVVDNDGIPYYGKDRQVHTGANPIPNYSFENWTPVSGISPDNWFNMMGPAEQVSPGYEGNHAIKMEYLGERQIGAIMSGVLVDFENGLEFIGGHPYSSRPDTLFGMFKYDIALGDSAVVRVMFRRNGLPISDQQFLIGGSSPTNYVSHQFPISFDSPLTPDSVLIGIMAANLFGSIVPQPGNWIIADDLKFNGNHVGILNGGFEDWTPFIFDHLDFWDYADRTHSFFPISEEGIVHQTVIAQEGNYAAELHNMNISEASGLAVSSNHYADGDMYTSLLSPSGNASFSVPHTPQALNGYYKFFPENGDTLSIICELYQSGNQYGIRNMLRITEEASEFTPFTLNLDEYSVSGIVDSASIYMETAGRNALGGSWAVFDNFRFDGFADLNEIIVGQSPQNEAREVEMELKIYPNPGTEFVTLEIESTSNQNLTVEFIDALGRVSKPLIMSNVVINSVNTKELPKGIYCIRIQDGESTVSKSWIKL